MGAGGPMRRRVLRHSATSFFIVAAALLVLAISLVQQPQAQTFVPANIVVCPSQIIPGSSAQLNYTIPNTIELGPSYTQYLEIAPPGQSCVAPGSIPACDEKVSPAPGPLPYPSGPCLLPAAQVSNSLNQYFSELQYYSNYSFTQGTYTVCGYYTYKATLSSGLYYYALGTGPTGTLTVTNQNLAGQTWGVNLDLGQSGGTVYAAMTPNTLSGSPYQTYIDSFGGSSTNFCSTSSQCILELASGNNQNGCVSPYDNTGAVQLPTCSGAPNYNMPCIIPSTRRSFRGAVSIDASFTPPSDGSYVVCGYDYSDGSPISYPSVSPYSSSPPSFSSVSGEMPKFSAPFFSAAPLLCSSGSCSPQPLSVGQCQTNQAQAPQGTGIVIVNPSTWGVKTPVCPTDSPDCAPTSPIATFNSFQIVSGSKLLLYVTPFDMAQSQSIQNICEAGYASAPACNGKNTQTGCVDTFDVSSSSSGTAVCNINNIPSSGSPFCYLDSGFTDSQGDNCCGSLTSSPVFYGLSSTAYEIQTTQADSTSITQPGNYLYCGMQILPTGGSARILGTGILVVLPVPLTSSGPNQGTVSLAAAIGQVCGIWQTVEPLLILLATILLLFGAILYEAATLMTAQMRGIMQSYAYSMILGGLIGVVVFAISAYTMSIIEGTSITAVIAQLYTACP